ncbi:MAG: Uncharacterised protein [Candidatus Poseidoniaceae archaeon]|nr:MAG: Uncharacterised protein [Candidatus Poseidoniaceae archaeon]
MFSTICLHVTMQNQMAAPRVEPILLLLVSLIPSSHRKCLRRPSNRRSRNRRPTCILQTFLLASRSTSKSSTSRRVKKKSLSMKIRLKLSSEANAQAAVFHFRSQTCLVEVESSTHVCSVSTVNCLKDRTLICAKKTRSDCSEDSNLLMLMSLSSVQLESDCYSKQFVSVLFHLKASKKESSPETSLKPSLSKTSSVPIRFKKTGHGTKRLV